MKKNKIIIIVCMLLGTILLIIGVILLKNKQSIPDNEVNKVEKSDEEKDLINLENYYLERNDVTVKSEHNFNDFIFCDVTFSGANGYYLFEGIIKNNSKKDVKSITFDIQFLDENSNVKFEYSGVASFDLESKVAIMHIETTKNIALYYDYKISNIKIN